MFRVSPGEAYCRAYTAPDAEHAQAAKRSSLNQRDFRLRQKAGTAFTTRLQAQAFEALPAGGSGRLPPLIEIEAALYLLVRWVFFMPTDGLRAKIYIFARMNSAIVVEKA
jgi:hypothetical protein